MYTYELNGKLEQLLNKVDETGELTDIEADLMDEIYKDLEPSMEGLIRSMNFQDEDMGALLGKKEYYAKKTKEINSSIKAIENKKGTRMNLLTSVMYNLGVDEKKVGNFVLKFHKKAAVLEIKDDAAIPMEFKKMIETIDKMALKKELKAGLVIEGVTLKGGQKLVIK